jgi:hypothetical protein
MATVYKITKAVGEAVKPGENLEADVRVIQTLLLDFFTPPDVGDPVVAVTGICDEATIEGIRFFQKLFWPSPDGKIDPGGRTFRKLVEIVALKFAPLPQGGTVGYYSYSAGSRQWGTEKTIESLKSVASQFATKKPGVNIGIGDISFRLGGKMSPHDSHQKGKNVDIRPLRTDGLQEPVSIDDDEYSHDDTKLLVEQLLADANVKSILFNDKKIPKVTYYQGHHNHLHVNFKE